MKNILTILKFESLVFFFLVLGAYFWLHFSWILFLLLFLVPDIAMAGYLKDKKMGALFYNLSHSYIIPSVLLSIGFFLSNTPLIAISLIWLGHISIDRALGYGLKLQSFTETHLGTIGKK